MEKCWRRTHGDDVCPSRRGMVSPTQPTSLSGPLVYGEKAPSATMYRQRNLRVTTIFPIFQEVLRVMSPRCVLCESATLDIHIRGARRTWPRPRTRTCTSPYNITSFIPTVAIDLALHLPLCRLFAPAAPK